MPPRIREKTYRFTQSCTDCDLSLCQNGTVTMSLMFETGDVILLLPREVGFGRCFILERHNLVGIETDH